MNKNTIIRVKTCNDIDRRVERVLKGIGNPEPPLDLLSVRDLLKLDLEYYTGDDPGILQEAVSRIRVAGKQVLKRPGLLIDAIRKFELRALYIPDQKRILLDRSQPELKHRWNETHEIGHSLLPWHEGAMLGDNRFTLLPHCHQQIEAEANFAAGRLLFLRDQFEKQAMHYAPTIAAVKALKPVFGNTYTTTFWRCIETWGTDIPIVGLITGHPHLVESEANYDAASPHQHFIQSKAFAEQFSSITATQAFDIIKTYCMPRVGGPLGEMKSILRDDNGDEHIFSFESFSFYHHVLSLGIYQSARAIAAGFPKNSKQPTTSF